MKKRALLYSKAKNKDIAKSIIELALDSNMIAIIVKTELSIMDRLLKHPLKIARCRSGIFYAVKEMNQVEIGVKSLMKMRMWHKPVFHILYCSRGTEFEIIKACSNKGNPVSFVEDVISQNIKAFIDPLDDDFEYYAEKPFLEDLVTKMPSLEPD